GATRRPGSGQTTALSRTRPDWTSLRASAGGRLSWDASTSATPRPASAREITNRRVGIAPSVLRNGLRASATNPKGQRGPPALTLRVGIETLDLLHDKGRGKITPFPMTPSVGLPIEHTVDQPGHRPDPCRLPLAAVPVDGTQRLIAAQPTEGV